MDGDGWTHITRGPPAKDVLDEECDPTYAEAPDPSVIAAQHERLAHQWKQRPQYKEIVDFFDQVLLKLDGFRIDRCMCVGMGSFTVSQFRTRWRDRNGNLCKGFGSRDVNVSFSQLVAFESWIELLRKKHSISEVLFQDPAFHDSDRLYLTSKGYKVVEPPTCETLLSENTFLFAPCLTHPVLETFLGKAFPNVAVVNPPQTLTYELKGPNKPHAYEYVRQRSLWKMSDYGRYCWLGGMAFAYPKEPTP